MTRYGLSHKTYIASTVIQTALLQAHAAEDNENHDFNFHNAHDLNTARDSSQEESIKRQLRERFANSKLLIVPHWSKDKASDEIREVGNGRGSSARPSNHRRESKWLTYSDDRSPPAIKEQLVVFAPFGQKSSPTAWTLGQPIISPTVLKEKPRLLLQ